MPATRRFDPVDPELDPAVTHAPRPQPDPGESVVVMELDELWHFLQKKRTSSGWLLIALPRRLGMS
jgi:hypothetical protein